MKKKIISEDQIVTRGILREEIKGFATKEDLKRFATKEDLKRFATKEDLKKELKAYATKEDLGEMGEHLAEVLTIEIKDTVTKSFDKVIKRLDDIDANIVIIGNDVEDLKKRVTRLESRKN